MAEDGNGRISVSRDALRADLAEMKNELKDYIAQQLDRKADADDLRPLVSTVGTLNEWSIRAQRGEFTEAQKNTVMRWVEESFRSRARDAWSSREKRLLIVSLAIGFLGAVGTVLSAFSFQL